MSGTTDDKTIINNRTVEYIQDLAPNRPVFKVRLWNGIELVIKQELSGNPVQGIDRYAAAAAVMGEVSSVAQAKVLAPDEVAALRSSPKATQNMRTALASTNGFFVKMKLKTGLENLGNAGQLAAILPTLANHQRFWFSLGEIVIADCFNGNNDRFMVQRGKLTLSNMANIFVKFDDHGALKKSIGMDFFDPNAGEAGWVHNNNIVDWTMNHAPLLTGQNSRIDQATRIVNSVLQLQTPAVIVKIIEFIGAKQNVAVQYTGNEGSWVMQGMESGKKKLQSYLQANKANLRPGVKARGEYLGWI